VIVTLQTSQPSLQIGIDIGGTFTDFVVYQPADGSLHTFKLLSTPEDPSQAVLSGVQRILGERPAASSLHIIHGSTVATNALLERKGARAALITTRGFRDVLQIGRQNRPDLYDLSADPPSPLIPEALRFEVDERVDSTGAVLVPLDPGQVVALIPDLQRLGVESVAVCLLFSFLHPEHEAEIGRLLRANGLRASLSSEVLPEYREYERMSTTAVNAYVSPVLDRYLASLEAGLAEILPGAGEVNLRVMQSNGGSIRVEEARQSGVRCILSGPAGGVVGAQHVARLAAALTREDQAVRIIGFDMGGTSTDVSLIEDAPQVTNEAAVGGCPIRIPLLDIHTIGAGGGSIARLDAGGALRVGPESAGADPGPACYGRGDLPTVTDANLVLGRLVGEHFLGGQMRLEAERAREVMARLGRELGLDAAQAALGVVEVANAHMERALRVISVERGHDPRRFSLLSFGGAGGLHAADLARRLGIPQVIVPPLASTLSAFGMLAAEVVKDYVQTVMLPGDTPIPALAKRLAPLMKRGLREVEAEGIPAQDIRLETALDMRCLGQSYELTVPFDADESEAALLRRFHRLHERAYGYVRPHAAVEIVSLRLRVVGQVEPPALLAGEESGADPSAALLELRPVVFPSGAIRTPFYEGERLLPANRLSGPAVVVRSDTTILIGPLDSAWVDAYGNLRIEVGKAT